MALRNELGYCKLQGGLYEEAEVKGKQDEESKGGTPGTP